LSATDGQAPMRGWFDPKLSLGNVLTIMTVIGGLAYGYGTTQATIGEITGNQKRIEKRVDRLEAKDEVQSATISTLQREIIARLVRLEVLIDKKGPP